MPKTAYKQWLALLLAMLLLTVFSLPVFAQAGGAGGRAVRVGVFSLGQFQSLQQGADGSSLPKGYNIDFLNEVTKKTHWKIEYVPCENWVDATAKLESGEIDLLAPAQRIDSLQERFDYAALYMGTESAAIYTKADSEIGFEDFEAMGRLTYGCAEGSTFTREFIETYCPDNGMDPTIRRYANTTELTAALQSGEVDAIVTNIMFAGEAYKMLGWFLVLPVYYIAQKGNDTLLSELDTAMRALLVEQPTLISDLANRYFPIYATTNLTTAEKDYLATLPEITIGYETGRSPISYTDEDGEFVGISRDLLDLVAENLGLKFRYRELPPGEVDWAYLKANNIRVLCNVEYNAENQSIPSLHLSAPYLQSERVVVAKDVLHFDPGAALRIATASGSGTLAASVRSVYPNFTVTKYETVEACLEAVNENEQQGALINRYVANNALQNPAYSDLEVVPIQGMSDNLCLAVLDFGDNSGYGNLINDASFISVVDKSIGRITTSKLNDIIIVNTSRARYTPTLGDSLRRYRWQLMAAAATALLLISLLAYVAISQRRAAEKQERLNGELEVAIDKADRANAAKSQFLAQMSHEIRTPMNAIIGLTCIAKNEVGDPEKVKDSLSKIEGSSKLLLGIINDVLDMSAIEGGKLKTENAPFNFKQTITDITTVFYQQTKQRGQQFEVHLNGVTEETLSGDELRVKQILMNLLSNSAKFTPAGGRIDLKVLQASLLQDKVHLRFSVSDTGCGMSEDMQKRLFQPFEQESASTARKHGGSGLGLSITKNLVEMMGGSIRVESELGKGSTFTVDLPFGVVDPPQTPAPCDFAKIRTLVVDDDAESRKYCGILLDRLGVPYDCVDRGEAALEALGEADDVGNAYKLCLVDWKMPEMSGIELTRQIREIFGNDTIVIIVSAYDLSEVERNGQEAGADYFIPKPLFQSTLFNALMNISGADPGHTKAKAESDDRNQQYDFTGKRVLLAEDVALNMEVAIKLLEMVGVKVTCAEDGQQALDIFKKESPGTFDAVLMDINMPVMDGYEATRAIRALATQGRPDAKTIPIFAMTANAFAEDVAAALDAGMNGHIAKPIETRILCRTLQTTWQEQKS